MKTTVDVLAGLIAVKELQIKILQERIVQLEEQVYILNTENLQLYQIIGEKPLKQTHIGFKKEGQ